VRITDQKREQISRLIVEGETLSPLDLDLEAFYRWAHVSREALGFHPLQQQRFDQYCSSSCDSYSIRVYVGLWILRLALGEASSDSKDYQNHLTSSKSILNLPRKGSSGPGRKR
jgi:hypothetical protein